MLRLEPVMGMIEVGGPVSDPPYLESGAARVEPAR